MCKIRVEIDGDAFSFSSAAQVSITEVRDDLRSVVMGAGDQAGRVRAISFSLNLYNDEQLELREYTEGTSNTGYLLAGTYYGDVRDFEFKLPVKK